MKNIKEFLDYLGDYGLGKRNLIMLCIIVVLFIVAIYLETKGY
jgi:hypothetical protein